MFIAVILRNCYRNECIFISGKVEFKIYFFPFFKRRPVAAYVYLFTGLVMSKENALRYGPVQTIEQGDGGKTSRYILKGYFYAQHLAFHAIRNI
ncbi:hypothetical protein D9M68_628130 [compost metagenome]